MTRSASFDPLLKFNFGVIISKEPEVGSEMSIEDILFRGGFTEVTSPKITINQKQYYEGGSFMNPHNINVNASYQPISLSRGVITPSFNYNKVVNDNAAGFANKKVNFADIVGLVFNAYNHESTLRSSGAGSYGIVTRKGNYRLRINIIHYGRDSVENIRYVMYNCTPTYYEPTSDFGSTADDSVSIEKITFSYEGFEYIDSRKELVNPDEYVDALIKNA